MIQRTYEAVSVLWLTMIRWRGRQSSRDSVSVGDLQQFVCEKTTETVAQLGGVLSTGYRWAVVGVQQFLCYTPCCSVIACNFLQSIGVEGAP